MAFRLPSMPTEPPSMTVTSSSSSSGNSEASSWSVVDDVTPPPATEQLAEALMGSPSRSEVHRGVQGWIERLERDADVGSDGIPDSISEELPSLASVDSSALLAELQGFGTATSHSAHPAQSLSSSSASHGDRSLASAFNEVAIPPTTSLQNSLRSSLPLSAGAPGSNETSPRQAAQLRTSGDLLDELIREYGLESSADEAEAVMELVAGPAGAIEAAEETAAEANAVQSTLEEPVIAVKAKSGRYLGIGGSTALLAIGLAAFAQRHQSSLEPLAATEQAPTVDFVIANYSTFCDAAVTLAHSITDEPSSVLGKHQSLLFSIAGVLLVVLYLSARYFPQERPAEKSRRTVSVAELRKRTTELARLARLHGLAVLSQVEDLVECQVVEAAEAGGEADTARAALFELRGRLALLQLASELAEDNAAEAWLRRALRADRKRASACILLGKALLRPSPPRLETAAPSTLLLEQERRKEALSVIERGIRLAKDGEEELMAEGHLLLARALLQGNRHATRQTRSATSTESHLEHAAKLAPTRSDVYALWSDVCLTAGDAVGAKLKIDLAIELNGERASYYVRRMRLALMAEEWETGLEAAKLARGVYEHHGLSCEEASEGDWMGTAFWASWLAVLRQVPIGKERAKRREQVARWAEDEVPVHATAWRVFGEVAKHCILDARDTEAVETAKLSPNVTLRKRATSSPAPTRSSRSRSKTVTFADHNEDDSSDGGATARPATRTAPTTPARTSRAASEITSTPTSASKKPLSKVALARLASLDDDLAVRIAASSSSDYLTVGLRAVVLACMREEERAQGVWMSSLARRSKQGAVEWSAGTETGAGALEIALDALWEEVHTL